MSNQEKSIKDISTVCLSPEELAKLSEYITEHKATKPKLSLAELFLGLERENPIPIAKINGTDIGPVVTPPESKANGTISFFDINNISNSVI